MATKTRVKLNTKKLYQDMMKHAANQQTERFAVYAAEQAAIMGDMLKIKMHGKPSDRTHNMLNSLVWAVYYDGKLDKHGFYRKSASTRGDAFLHELSDEPIPVNGRELANQFLVAYQPREKRGWEIVWGVLAPYYAYWEHGHKNLFYGRFVKFNMMSQRYDEIRNTLGAKARVTIDVHVPKY